ncbi:MAG TPA: DUF3556 domain-containing protein [Candidatus Acidoferrales bacterium]|nr:DUF3556 domain-containing protein [Candidatus Acidoferrales bacterium]
MNQSSAESQALHSRPNFTELVRAGCEDYVLKGIGLPIVAYIFHAVKLSLLVLAWMYFCSFTPGLGSPTRFGEWWATGIAFQKAFIFGCMIEVLGFGCMSGPLGFHIWPPFTAFLHFLRPGTIKLAPFPNLPLFGGQTRTWLDVGLYAAFIGSLLRALVAPEIGTAELAPIVVLLPLCGLGDKTILLAARVEHHFAMIVCFLLAGNWIAACKAVQLAIWFWAGVSKLTVAFGYVVPVMTVNNPMFKSPSLRRRMFVSYPDDLTPSRLGVAMAHGGTFLEFAAPLTLLFVTHPGPLLVLGMIFVLMLHGFILSNMPAGAVFEWNLISLYAAFFLFVGHTSVSILDVGSLPLTIYLFIGLIALPLFGNLVPSRVSFLVAMRYYAGNWAWNAWLFRGDSYKKLDQVKRASPLLREQLQRFAPEEAGSMDSRGMAFRSLHLQGRTLGLLLPRAISGRPFEEYNYVDGENVAASVLGWNFGEGHLCDERLLACIQAQCNYEDGELRAIMVESQPLLGSTLHWRIVDAKRGLLEEGYVELDELKKRAPWDYGPLLSAGGGRRA